MIIIVLPALVDLKTNALAQMAAASPDVEIQSFLALVFVNRQYSGKLE